MQEVLAWVVLVAIVFVAAVSLAVLAAALLAWRRGELSWKALVGIGLLRGGVVVACALAVARGAFGVSVDGPLLALVPVLVASILWGRFVVPRDEPSAPSDPPPASLE